MATSTQGQFARDLRKFQEKTGIRMETLCRRVAFMAFSRVIYKTPVDTGRARANWVTSIGSPLGGNSTKVDPSGSVTLKDMSETVAKFRMGQTIFLANGLPYIQRLENGWSKQAAGPNAMVGATMVEIQTIFRDAVKELG